MSWWSKFVLNWNAYSAEVEARAPSLQSCANRHYNFKKKRRAPPFRAERVEQRTVLRVHRDRWCRMLLLLVEIHTHNISFPLFL